MKKLLFSSLLICIACYTSAPSKFVESARFYSQDFRRNPGMKTLCFTTEIGIIRDEIFIGRPRVYVNDSIVLCDCEKEAVTISFKDGILTAKCEEHCVKIEPVNQVKYPTTKKAPEEINNKPEGVKHIKSEGT